MYNGNLSKYNHYVLVKYILLHALGTCDPRHILMVSEDVHFLQLVPDLFPLVVCLQFIERVLRMNEVHITLWQVFETVNLVKIA